MGTRLKQTSKAAAYKRKPKIPTFPKTPSLGKKSKTRVGAKKGVRSHTQPSMKKDRYSRIDMRQKIKKQDKQDAKKR